MLEQEFQYYLENQEELVKLYDGKVLVITGLKVVMAVDTFDEAYKEGEKQYGLGNFIIQRCSPGEKDYTVTYYTHRVSFA